MSNENSDGMLIWSEKLSQYDSCPTSLLSTIGVRKRELTLALLTDGDIINQINGPFNFAPHSG